MTMETITHAALRHKRKVYVSNAHYKIFEQEPKGILLNAEEGFKTSKGRFVNRKEAGRIAFDAKQIDKQTIWLQSHMLEL